MKSLLFFSILFAVSCSTMRKPANVQDSSLLDHLDKWNKMPWSSQSCSRDLNQILQTLTDFQRQEAALHFSEADWKAYQALVFRFHSNTSKIMSEDCALKLRSIYSLLRSYQDWTAEKLFEKSQPVAYGENSQTIDIGNFPFRTGDVLLTECSLQLAEGGSMKFTSTWQWDSR